MSGMTVDWREKVAGWQSSLDLPLDAEKDRGVASASRELPPELGAQLEAVAGHAAVPVSALALAALHALLMRYSRTGDILSTALIDGAGPILVRPSDDADARFASLVQDVTAQVYAAPLPPSPAEIGAMDAAAGRPPLAFLFEWRRDDSELDRGPARFSGIGIEGFELLLSMTAVEDRVHSVLHFDRAVLGRASAERLLTHFEVLLRSAMGSLDARIYQLTIMPPEEHELVGRTWNATRADYPREASIPQLFREQVQRGPDAIAIEANGRAITYERLDTESNRIAGHLGKAGVRAGELVGLSMDRCAEVVTAALGILKAGCAYVPLDPEYPDARLDFMLGDTDIRVVLADRAAKERLAKVGRAGVKFLEVRELVESASDAPVPEVAPTGDDLAYVMYTSGSTGVPKGVRALQRGVVRLVRATSYIDLPPGERVMAFAPISFDASTLEIWGPLLNGGTVVVAPAGPLSIDDLGSFIEAAGVTTLWLTAALFHELVDARVHSFANVRQLLAGGDVLSPDRVRRVLAACPSCAVINGYGPTENTTFTSCHRMTAGDAVGATVPIGRPIANTTTYVLGPSGELMPVGVPGELFAGGDGVAAGYLNRPDLTNERFVQNRFGDSPEGRLYRTGDLVRWRPEGVLEFLGRIDQQVKVRGYRVELGEIEARLGKHPSVRNSVAVAAEHDGEKRLVAYVVAGEEVERPTSAELRSYVRQHLPEYMVPSFIVFIDQVPVTANGKVDRQALPSPFDERSTPAAGARSRTEQSGSVNELERILHEVWCRLLGIGDVGADDLFFDVGGTSLLSLRVVDTLKREYDVSVPIVMLYEHPTIRSLARALHAAHQDAPASRERSTRTAGRDRQSKDDRRVAIIGMAGRFPGAGDVDALWRNLRAGRDGRVELSIDELRAEGVPDSLIGNPDYVRATFPLDGAEDFDAAFFGLRPREAELMDPQQRLFLELAWTALEDAGYDPKAVPGRVGVFGGVGRNSYLMNRLAPHTELADTLAEHPGLIGNEKDFPTTHVSFRLGLTGPSIDVQSACSTSGVAAHLAKQSLLLGESDVALAGGCKVIIPNRVGYMYEEGGALSPEARIRAFDAKAQGMVRGSGGAMLVLKRYADAVRDGDRVLAVILGSAVNNDGGLRAGFAAPSPEGQARVITDALEDADLQADAIDYVETHGTGTALGDPIEVEGLTRAYRQSSGAVGFCRIGSIKTNIGHLDAGATAAGIIKTILALRHEEIPPSINFDAPNPHIPFSESPFRVNSELTPWPRGDRPRRAGVSSFGLGGTNAHIVLEEPPADRASDPPSRPAQVIAFSALTESALRAAGQQLAARLDSTHEPAEFADLAYTLQTGRHRLPHRRVVVAPDARRAAEALRETDGTRDIVREGPDDARLVYMFPGGGSQYPGMARDLWKHEPVFRRAIQECDEILGGIAGIGLVEALFSAESEVDMERPSIALPALFAVEVALADLWSSWGVKPTALLGHSMGEYTAAHVAGVMSRYDALALVAERGRLFDTLPPGSMLAVPLPEQDVVEYLGESLSIAAINRPDATIVSGDDESVDALERRLAASDVEATRVRIAVAAHSRMVEPILGEFERFVRSVKLLPPQLPLVSNVSGTWLRPEEATDAMYWVRHLRRTVRFADGISTVAKSGGSILLEVGPGRALGSQVRYHPDARGVDVVASTRHPKEEHDDVLFLLRSLGEIWASGGSVDWTGVHGTDRRRRTSAPTYPFERERFSVPPKAIPGGPPAVPPQPALLVQPQAGLPPTTPSVPSMSPPPTVAPRPRRERIIEDLRGIVHELSGIEHARLSARATFLELGFDSLFLAQANTRFKRHFKVKLSVRQLLETTPSIAALAEHLEAQLPPDFYPPETAPTTSGAWTPSPHVSPFPAATPMDQSTRPPASDQLQWLIQQQLDVMRQQLAVLGGGNPAALAPPAAVPASEGPSSPAKAERVAPGAPRAGAGPTVHGPWRPIDKERRGLGERQLEAIAELTDRVTRKTAKSKAFAAATRRALADPRSVVGFRSEWKELTYSLVVDKAHGSKLWDIDGNEYVDVVGAFGVNFLGHSPEFVTEAVRRQLDAGFAIGPQVELAGEVAKLVSEVTGMERVTFCNTGSEAVLAALRIARTVTGNDRIASFSTHYHGIFDEVLVKAVDVGNERKNFPIAPGIPQHAVETGLILDYGDPSALDAIREHADELACVILEPVRSRSPSVQPFEFLRELRALTEELDIPLIFDEMITGFRSHLGGAQALLGIRADIATYGKIIGGGYPIGVVAGSAKYMDALDGGHWEFGDGSIPEADMTWFAGTFVRHPVALAAAHASLTYLKQRGPGLQEALNSRNARWVAEMNEWFEANRVSLRFEYFSSFFMATYLEHEPYSDLLPYYLLLQGVYSRETRPLFWSVAHTDEDWMRVAEAYKASALEMRDAGLLGAGERGAAGAAPSSSSNEERTVPLTPGQQEIWLVALRGTDASCAYNLCSTVQLRGNLDADSLEAAFHDLIRRHEALRAVPSRDGKSQRIPPDVRVPFERIDLTELDEAGRASRRAEIEHGEVSTPFDMLNGPLVRAKLLRLDAGEHLLLLTAHHVICDGWSCGVIMRNLAELYGARVDGRPANLQDVMQLTEWVEECRIRASSEEGRDSMDYWTEQLASPPAPLEMPSDRQRPPLKTYGARRTWLTLDPEESGQIREGSKSLGSTVFVTLLTGFYAFLNRVTGASDIVVGFSLAGQSRFGGRDLVSHCVDFLPIRAKLDPQASFRSQVKEVQGRFLDAMEYQHCTFGDLVRRVNPPRDKSRVPLAQVAFNLDPSTKGIEFAGLESHVGSVPREFENMDAFFNVVERSDDLFEVQCTFNLDLFDEADVAGWLEGLRDLVLGALEDPGRPIVDLRTPSGPGRKTPAPEVPTVT